MTVEKVVVEVDTSTLKKRADHDSITGMVFIRGESACFPEKCWTDFPVVILNWWLDPVYRVREGKTRLWRCTFMDGPCVALLEQRDGDTWRLTGIHNEKAVFIVALSCDAFICSLLDSACAVLAACKQHGWQTRDIDNLASTIRMLKDEAG